MGKHLVTWNIYDNGIYNLEKDWKQPNTQQQGTD